ncbi:hypothetical protein O181_044192 [Austropuccinia psidii MF-1]|uniref:Phytase n=1 Tax=Austropuccinia psidii MF-1 TaxID=1389203 RepID=A0A9Q3HHI8_9BASI|nr:hypothetical protein [Austropuccinia psidii MF-1]
MIISLGILLLNSLSSTSKAHIFPIFTHRSDLHCSVDLAGGFLCISSPCSLWFAQMGHRFLEFLRSGQLLSRLTLNTKYKISHQDGPSIPQDPPQKPFNEDFNAFIQDFNLFLDFATPHSIFSNDLVPPQDFLPPWILLNAGPSSPFHTSHPYKPIPKSCILTQVNQIQRHGSRYPTLKVSVAIKKALEKLNQSTHLDSSLRFLKHYKYQLGISSLIKLGKQESFQSGVIFAIRYSSLLNSKLPFLRASLSQRVIDSSLSFARGLSTIIDPHQNQPPSLIKPIVISEDPNSNNTLDNNSCPNRPLATQQTKWLRIFGPPIAKKLNDLAPNSNLSEADALALMQLCIFESLSKQKISQFCRLFDKSDWIKFEYFFDLEKYYGYGLGNRLQGIEGLGYVAELISRLTGDRNWVSNDQTKVNQTLDQSNLTFPLDRSSYVDFSHDNQMINILAVTGLQINENLPAIGPIPINRRWIVSEWMPFGSRLTTEKMICSDNREYVRFLLNDLILQASFCQDDSDLSILNICKLDNFVNSQRIKLKDGQENYMQCLGDKKQEEK